MEHAFWKRGECVETWKREGAGDVGQREEDWCDSEAALEVRAAGERTAAEMDRAFWF